MLPPFKTTIKASFYNSIFIVNAGNNFAEKITKEL